MHSARSTKPCSPRPRVTGGFLGPPGVRNGQWHLICNASPISSTDGATTYGQNHPHSTDDLDHHCRNRHRYSFICRVSCPCRARRTT